MRGRRSQVISSFVLTLFVFIALDGQAQSPVGYSSPPGYSDALEREMYEEAEVIAKSEIAKMLQEGRGGEMSSAFLYSDLANAQRLARNLPAASLNYELAIDIIERTGDRMNVALEIPLQGLGMTALDSRRPDLALESFNRAIHVRQVSDGPHSIDQAKSLELLASAHAAAGNEDKSIAMTDRLGMLIQRHADDPDVDVVGLRLTQGALYRDLGKRESERAAYSQAVASIRTRAEVDDQLLIEPYVRTGESFLFEYFENYASATNQDELPDKHLLEESARQFEIANELAAASTGEDWTLRYRALLALGDFYSFTANFSRARQAYRESWELLTQEPSRLARRKADLEVAVPLWQPLPTIHGTGVVLITDTAAGNDLYEGELTIGFTVSQRGRLTNIALVESNSPERQPRLEARLKESLGSFVYRPRIERGFLVDSADQQLRFGYTESSDNNNNR